METDPLFPSPAHPLARTLRSRIANLYHRYERYAGIAIFGLGFIWDSLTMVRVDNLIDNIILLFYLIIIGTMIILTLRRQGGKALPKWIQRFEPRLLWAMQWCFGGLFSSYVIFYFKSASWTRTQFFFLVLVLLWVGNEFLPHRLQNPELPRFSIASAFFPFLPSFCPSFWPR